MGHSLRHPYIPRSTTEAFFCNSYPGYRLTTYLNFPKNLHSNTGTGDYFPKKVISS